MTSKERMYAAIDGRKPDCCPVASPYIHLSNADHWEELTGLPVWKYYEWLISADMDWYKEVCRVMYSRFQFDIVQPMDKWSDENTEVVCRDGAYFYHYKKEDAYNRLPDNIHNAGSGGGENETRYVFTKQDAKNRIKITKSEQLISYGCNKYIDEIIKMFGDTHFIVTAGVVNTFYSNAYHVGMTDFYSMLIEEPELIKYISELVLEQNIENIRAYAFAGGDAIFIDDATATCDMISPEMYEEFSLPYLTQQVKEIQRFGKKAILVYFGGIADRIDMIKSTGADVLMMECSMKGYINDYSDISKKLGENICLAGNLNPYTDVEITTDNELAAKIREMAKKGMEHGRYFTSTGSPLTPNTTVERIQKYIDISHKITI
jgi:hypothetical protein